MALGVFISQAVNQTNDNAAAVKAKNITDGDARIIHHELCSLDPIT
jgi:hypothetical protein